MYVLFTTGVGPWLAVGSMTGRTPVAVANAIVLRVAGTALVMKA